LQPFKQLQNGWCGVGGRRSVVVVARILSIFRGSAQSFCSDFRIRKSSFGYFKRRLSLAVRLKIDS